MPWSGRETLCAKCEAERKPKHKIYMHFMLANGWYCQFLEADLKTPLPKKLTVKTPEDIRGMIDRVGSSMTPEERQGFEYAIATGRGSVWLMLSDDAVSEIETTLGSGL